MMGNIKNIMKSLFQKIRRKLNVKGESMAEVLVAALIIELALIAAASMIISAGNIIRKSKAKYDAYYTTKNEIAREENLVDDSDDSDDSDKKKVEIKAKNGSAVFRIDVDVKKTNSDKPIYIYEKAGS